MTTVKACLARLLPLLLACVICFSACKDTGGDPFEALTVSSSEADPGSVSSDFIAYRVVLPHDCGADVISAADQLAAAIESQTGVLTYTLFDYETDWNSDGQVREILLGRSDRPLSDYYLSDLNRDDYIGVEHGETLVLGGPGDNATLAALQVYLSQWVTRATAGDLLPQGVEFSSYARYEWSGAEINSYHIKEYTIVYPSLNQHRERRIALALRDAIADRCGVYPRVVSDAAFTGNGRAILVGTCFGEMPYMAEQTAYISADGLYLKLYAPDSYGISMAAERFCERLFASSEDSMARLTLTEELALFYERPRLSLLSLTSAWYGSSANAFETLTELTVSSAAELITLGRMEAEVWRTLELNLPSVFEVETVTLEDGSILPFLLRKSALSRTAETVCREESGALLLEFSLTSVRDAEPVTVFYLYEDGAADGAALYAMLKENCLQADSSAAVIVDASSSGASLLEAAEADGVSVIARNCALPQGQRVLAVLPTGYLADVQGLVRGEYASYGLQYFYQLTVLERALVS